MLKAAYNWKLVGCDPGIHTIPTTPCNYSTIQWNTLRLDWGWTSLHLA
jgi:hypothetical protein